MLKIDQAIRSDTLGLLRLLFAIRFRIDLLAINSGCLLYRVSSER